MVTLCCDYLSFLIGLVDGPEHWILGGQHANLELLVWTGSARVQVLQIADRNLKCKLKEDPPHRCMQKRFIDMSYFRVTQLMLCTSFKLAAQPSRNHVAHSAEGAAEVLIFSCWLWLQHCEEGRAYV